MFTTGTLHHTERLAASRESMRVFLDSSRPQRPDDFTGEVEGYLIGGILLTRGIASQQKYDWPTSKIAGDSLDHSQCDCSVTSGPGSGAGGAMPVFGAFGTGVTKTLCCPNIR